MHAAYKFLKKGSSSSIVRQLGIDRKTAAAWHRFFRQALAWDVDIEIEDARKIGGPGLIVEIDESKFGKGKYNAGHRVEGAWVVGGCKNNGRGLFAVPVKNRSAATLLRMIQTYVHQDSIIYTDCWAGYNTDDLFNAGFHRQTVNHTYNLVNPINGVHTNTIEGTWSAMKACITRRHRTHIGNKLLAFIWRRKNENHLWERFLFVIGHIECEDVDLDAPIPPDIMDAFDEMDI